MTMKKKEILKENNQQELRRFIREAREKLRRFRFAVSQSKAKNVKEGRETRKAIARAFTRLNKIQKT